MIMIIIITSNNKQTFIWLVGWLVVGLPLIGVPLLLLALINNSRADTGSTDTQGPRDGNAGKKSSRSRMRGLLDFRKARSQAALRARRKATAKPSHAATGASHPATGGRAQRYGDCEFQPPPPLSTGNAQVWSHRSAAVSCPMPCSCSSAPSPVPSGPR